MFAVKFTDGSVTRTAAYEADQEAAAGLLLNIVLAEWCEDPEFGKVSVTLSHTDALQPSITVDHDNGTDTYFLDEVK